METILLIAYCVIALFMAGVASHFVFDQETGVLWGAFGALISLFMGMAWIPMLALLGLCVVVKALVQAGRKVGKAVDAHTLQWIAVLLIVLCIAVPTQVHASTDPVAPDASTYLYAEGLHYACRWMVDPVDASMMGTTVRWYMVGGAHSFTAFQTWIWEEGQKPSMKVNAKLDLAAAADYYGRGDAPAINRGWLSWPEPDKGSCHAVAILGLQKGK